MSWIFQYTATPDDGANLVPATGAYVAFYLKECLKQAGWTVQSSSDGTTYNAGGDQITTGAAGAGGMANNSAWFRIRSPAGAGGRELTFQRGTTNLLWRHKLSHTSGFTGGSPGATQTPSAADERIVAGAGTDAAPTFITWLAADASYKAHVGADNAAPYDAYVIMVPNGGGSARRWWHVNMATGSYPSGDVAPYVVEMATGAFTKAALSGVSVQSANFGQGFYKKGLGGESFRTFRGFMYTNSSGTDLVPQSAGINPYDSDDNLFPIPVGRISGTDADPGWKGFAPTSMMGWPGSTRSDGDYTNVGALRYAYWGVLALRFSPNATPSL